MGVSYGSNPAVVIIVVEETLLGGKIVCLIPARTDTQYWHDYVMNANEIRFIKGRLCFGDSKSSAPFPSCVVVFRPYFGKKV